MSSQTMSTTPEHYPVHTSIGHEGVIWPLDPHFFTQSLCSFRLWTTPEFSLKGSAAATAPECSHYPLTVSQDPYNYDTTHREWGKELPIHFLTRGTSGVRLQDAFRGDIEDMDDKDSLPFDEDCKAITMRIQFPGYDSSADVERKLKQGVINRIAITPQMQVSTEIHGVPVTRGRLVVEVARRIYWHISDLEDNTKLFQLKDRVGEQWRLGLGRMQFGYMIITELVNVSSGIWSPVIHVEQVE